MSHALNLQPGLDESAVVERVVPGKLVYVRTDNGSPPQTYGFKLDQLLIRKADGSLQPYRGEPLSDWGLASGKKVVVWGIKHRDVEPTLVVDADGPKGFNVSIGAISGAVNTSISNTAAIIGKLFKD